MNYIIALVIIILFVIILPGHKSTALDLNIETLKGNSFSNSGISKFQDGNVTCYLSHVYPGNSISCVKN